MGSSPALSIARSVLKGTLEIGDLRFPLPELPERMQKEGWEAEHLQQMAAFIQEWRDEKEELEVLTSGSTGERKPLYLPKEGMRESARMTIAHYGIPEGAHALLCLSAGYIAGKMMLVRAMEGDWTIRAIPPSRDPIGDLEGEELRFAFSAMVPMQVMEALRDQEKRKAFEGIETLIIGGAPLSQELEHRVRSCSNRCFATYGMTETMTHIADRPLNGPDADDRFTPMEGVELESDRRGCLLIRAPHLFEGEVKTNDLVALGEGGKFRIRGRYDRLINSGAVKLLPEELEDKLGPVMDRRFFIDKESDEELGETAVLYLEGAPLDPSTEKLLWSLMKERLEAYEIPKHIRSVPAFAETGSGKIDRMRSK